MRSAAACTPDRTYPEAEGSGLLGLVSTSGTGDFAKTTLPLRPLGTTLSPAAERSRQARRGRPSGLVGGGAEGLALCCQISGGRGHPDSFRRPRRPARPTDPVAGSGGSLSGLDSVRSRARSTLSCARGPNSAAERTGRGSSRSACTSHLRGRPTSAARSGGVLRRRVRRLS